MIRERGQRKKVDGGSSSGEKRNEVERRADEERWREEREGRRRGNLDRLGPLGLADLILVDHSDFAALCRQVEHRHAVLSLRESLLAISIS